MTLSLCLVVWPRLGDPFVFQNFKEVSSSHLQDGFCFVHIPFVRTVTFRLLAQFQVEHFPQPVVSSFIHSLRLFPKFAYYSIDRFVSVTT